MSVFITTSGHRKHLTLKFLYNTYKGQCIQRLHVSPTWFWRSEHQTHHPALAAHGELPGQEQPPEPLPTPLTTEAAPRDSLGHLTFRCLTQVKLISAKVLPPPSLSQGNKKVLAVKSLSLQWMALDPAAPGGIPGPENGEGRHRSKDAEGDAVWHAVPRDEPQESLLQTQNCSPAEQLEVDHRLCLPPASVSLPLPSGAGAWESWHVCWVWRGWKETQGWAGTGWTGHDPTTKYNVKRAIFHPQPPFSQFYLLCAFSWPLPIPV